MKKAYLDEYIEKTALDRRKYCRCGSHIYNVCCQLSPWPEDDRKWWVQCFECGNETAHYFTKGEAIRAWIKLNT